MANTTVNRQVNIFIASGEAEKAYDRLIQKEKTLKEELKKATDPKDVQRLQKELSKLSEPIDRAGKKLRGELTPSMRELENTIKSLQRQLKNVDQGSLEFNKLALSVRQAEIALAGAKKRASEISDTLDKKSGLKSFFRDFASGFGVGAGVASVQAVGAALKSFFEGSIQEALQAEAAAARLHSTLDNLGKADAFDRLTGKADQLAKKFKFIDNDDIIGVFDKLISYGKLTEGQIDNLLPVIINFGAKSRISLEESTSIIIKALEGNGKALKEYGINIKDAGTHSERLKVIFDQLQPRVEGAAEAFGNTLAGSIAKSEQSFRDLQETVGNKILPLKVKLLEFTNEVISGFQKLGATISLSFSAGINPFKADKLRRDVEAETQFVTEQAQKEFDAVKNLSKADLTSEIIRLSAELEKSEKILQGARIQKDTGDRVEHFRLRIEVLKALLPQLKDQLKNADNLLGFGGTEDAGKTAKNLDLSAELTRLAEKLKELAVFNGDELEKEIVKVNKFYDELIDSAKKKNAEFLKQEGLTAHQREAAAQELKKFLIDAEQTRVDETALVIDKFLQKIEDLEVARVKRRNKRIKEEQDKLNEERMQQLQKFAEELAKQAATAAEKTIGERRFHDEVNAEFGRQKARLQARLDLLEIERTAEIAAAEKTGKSVFDINRKYDALERLEKIKAAQELILSVTGIVAQISTAITTFLDLQSQKEQSQLEADRQSNERKKNGYQRQLNSKLISQAEYNRKIEQLDKQQEEKEKQAKIREFNRNKITKLANAVVNVAEQVASVIANPFMAALVATLGAIEIGMIASEKPPKFAKGGRLEGPSHSDGGMPVINPRTGRVEAEMEGGEVVLSRNTVSNNAGLVNQLLNSSLYRNGATINPAWRNTSPGYFNIPAITRSMQAVRLFEKGGVFDGAVSNQADNMILQNLNDSIDVLNAHLAGGIKAYTLLTEHELQQDRLNAIRKDAKAQ